MNVQVGVGEAIGILNGLQCGDSGVSTRYVKYKK